MYKIWRLKEPQYLTDLFKPYKSNRPARGNPKDIEIPNTGIKLADSAFRKQGARFWNMLPSEIRDSPSLNIFKNRLREQLCDLDFENC